MGRALLGDADMTDTPKDPPELTSDNKDCAMTTDHDEPHSPPDDTPPPEPPKENLIHLNPGGVSKAGWFALCSCASVSYAEASKAQGD